MVLLGWLIPRWTLNEIIARERQRGDEWRAAAEAKAAEAQVLVAQLAELIELGRTTDAFIRSLRAPTSTAAHPEE